MSKPKPHKQYEVKNPPFDAFPKDSQVAAALGSQRVKSIQEVTEIRSTNFVPGVSGWRLTNRGIEFGSSGGSFPPGSITFTDIQDIATDKLLGRDSAGTGSIEQLGLGAGLSIIGGNLVNTITQYTDELAQDAVGGMVADTNTIDLTYVDATPALTAAVRYQDTATIDLGDDSSGLKADIIAQYRHKSIFVHFADVGNVGTGEDDLYSDTIPAAQLANNGERLEAEYAGIFVSSATATRQIRFYFGGTLIFDTGALTLSLSAAWTAYVSIVRVSASVVRCMISLTTEGAALAAYTAYTEVTGLTLANTQILKVTGEAAAVGAATNDIVAKMSNVTWHAAP